MGFLVVGSEFFFLSFGLCLVLGFKPRKFHMTDPATFE